MDSANAEVTAVLDSRTEAIRTKDIDRLMSAYAPDIVYFDVVPPLRYVGAAALRERFLHWFGLWETGIGQEPHELDIDESGDLAVAHMLVHASGTLVDGREVGYWVRASDFCRRLDGRWLVTHEHVSLPVDFATGRLVMDLVP